MAIEYFKQALVIYEQLNDRRKLAAIHSQLGREYFSSGNREVIDEKKAVAHLHQAREILESLPESPALGLVYCGLGRVYTPLLDPNQSIVWATKAMAAGERLRHPAVVANACTGLGSAYALTGDVVQGLSYLEQAWEIASKHELAFPADFTRSLGVRICGVWLKNPRAGIAWAERKPVYQTKNDLLVFRSALIGVYALLGLFNEAEAVLKEYWDKLEESDKTAESVLHAEEGMLFARMGRLSEAERGLRNGIEWSTHNQHLLIGASSKMQLGRLYLDQGSLPEADQCLRDSLSGFRRGDNKLPQAGVLAALIRLFVVVGDLPQAVKCASEMNAIRPPGDLWQGGTGEVALATAVIQSALGDAGATDSSFRQAVAINERYELPWDEGEAYFLWATHLLQRQGSPDKERAREYFGRAPDLWNALGSARHAAACAEQMAGL